MKVDVNPANKGFVKVGQLNIGQMGVVEDPQLPNYFGRVLLRTYDGVVRLNNPGSTWGSSCSILVKPLPVGSTVTLTAE